MQIKKYVLGVLLTLCVHAEVRAEITFSDNGSSANKEISLEDFLALPQKEQRLYRSMTVKNDGSEDITVPETISNLSMIDCQVRTIHGKISRNTRIEGCPNLLEITADPACEFLLLTDLPDFTDIIGDLPKNTTLLGCPQVKKLKANTASNSLRLSDLENLTEIVGDLPYDANIEYCPNPKKINVRPSSASLKIQELENLTEIIGELPEEAIIRNCPNLKGVTVSLSSNSLRLSRLQNLKEIVGPIPPKTSIVLCPEIQRLDAAVCDVPANAEDQTRFNTFLKDQKKENLPFFLDYLDPLPKVDIKNITFILKGTYSMETFFSMVASARENPNAFNLRFHPDLVLHSDGVKRSQKPIEQMLDIIKKNEEDILSSEENLRISGKDIPLPICLQQSPLNFDEKDQDKLFRFLLNPSYSEKEVTIHLGGDLKLTSKKKALAGPSLTLQEAFTKFLFHPEHRGTLTIHVKDLQSYENILCASLKNTNCKIVSGAIAANQEEIRKSFENILVKIKNFAVTENKHLCLYGKIYDDFIHIHGNTSDHLLPGLYFLKANDENCSLSGNSETVLFTFPSIFGKTLTEKDLIEISNECGIPVFEEQKKKAIQEKFVEGNS